MNWSEYFNEENNDKNIDKKLKRNIVEMIFGNFGKINIDYDNKKFIITNINYKKFLQRISSMLNTRKVNKLFEPKFTKLSTYLWTHKMISKNERKISQLEVPLFFALEMYNLFMELGDYYSLKYYNNLAKKIYNLTWISNYEKKDMSSLQTTEIEYINKLSFEPKYYQKEFILNYKKLKYIYDLDGYILSFDQGLGKTFTSIALAEVLQKDKIIIVCPNTLKENWAYEIKSYYNKYNNIIQWKKDIYIQGNSNFNNFSNSTKYVITNIESIPKIFDKVKNYKNPMIIVDESHNFRNLNSKRTTELLKLKEITKSKDVLMMSGTPIKALPTEIIPALLMIDPYFTLEMADIYNKTFNIEGTAISSIVKARFDRDIYRRTKSEVLSLPNKYTEIVRLSIKDPTKYSYNEIKNIVHNRFIEIYEEKKKNNKNLMKDFTKLVLTYSDASKKETANFLRYITYTTNTEKLMVVHDYDQKLFDDFLKVHVFPNIQDPIELKKATKLRSDYIYMKHQSIGMALGEYMPIARENAYIDIINENIDYFIKKIEDCPKKTIIFTQFKNVADEVYKLLQSKKIGVVKITGITKNRMDYIQQFKNDDSIDVLVATSQTLSTGVTLVEASQMFFLGTPWRSTDWDQACDRIYRIGQTQDVYIYNILLESSFKNITDRIQDSVDWSQDSFDNMLNESINSETYYGEEYEPPMSLKEIKQKYGNNLYNKLKSDPVYKWRAETGIELIHKEPSKEELERIMKNWELMDDRRKRLSDKKSMEVFGCNNIDNYKKLIKTYKEPINETPLETRLTDIRSNFEKEVTLYHGTDHKIPNNIIDPAYGRINVGTRLSGPRYSTWWTKNPFFPFYYCCNEVLTKILYDNGYIERGTKINLLNLFELTKRYFCVDADNNVLYINKILKNDIMKNLNKNPGYIYKVTVPWKLVGRGHDVTLDEYTLDIPVQAEEIVVDYKTLCRNIDIRFIDESECVLRSTKLHIKKGDLEFRKVPFMHKLIYHKMEDRRVKYSKMYNNDLTRRKQERLKNK